MINQNKVNHYLNTQCYNFERLEFESSGVFDSFIDATYIMTMEGSVRSKEVYKKLKEFYPTSLVFISHNKGFKKCKKILYEQKIPYDVINSYYNVFNHSRKNNFNNILLLEDDFEFDTEVMNANMVYDIKTFFDKNKKRTFFYNLGGLPILLQYPFMIDMCHYKMLQTFPSHCIIYNRNIQHEILKNVYYPTEKVEFFDLWITKKFESYIYKYPCCYQVFPDTEQSQLWSNPFSKFVIRSTNLHKKSKPGYRILFFTILIINYLFYFIIFGSILFIIIYSILRNFPNKNKNK
jgi:hypothetical protein